MRSVALGAEEILQRRRIRIGLISPQVRRTRTFWNKEAGGESGRKGSQSDLRIWRFTEKVRVSRKADRKQAITAREKKES